MRVRTWLLWPWLVCCSDRVLCSLSVEHVRDAVAASHRTARSVDTRGARTRGRLGDVGLGVAAIRPDLEARACCMDGSLARTGNRVTPQPRRARAAGSGGLSHDREVGAVACGPCGARSVRGDLRAAHRL